MSATACQDILSRGGIAPLAGQVLGGHFSRLGYHAHAWTRTRSTHNGVGCGQFLRKYDCRTC